MRLRIACCLPLLCMAGCEHSINGLNLDWKQAQTLSPLAAMQVDGASPYDIDPAKNLPLVKWFASDEERGIEILRYVILCSYGPEQRVTWRSWVLHGRFGLSSTPNQPFSDATARRWISACILAHANQRHAKQPISLRGDGLQAAPGDRFAMGYPEGVFAGDLFEAWDKQERFTVSLNLPAGFDPATAGWRPPNAALGRLLDFGGNAASNSPLVRYLSECQGTGGAPPVPNTSRFGDAGGADPVHRSQALCPGGTFAAGCGGGLFRPLFVYLPWLVNLEEWSTGAPDPAQRTQAVLLQPGSPPSSQRACRAPGETPGTSGAASCIGPYDPMEETSEGVCGWRSTKWTPPGAVPGYVRLTENARLQAIVRSVRDDDPAQAGVGEATAFTALVRFRNNTNGAVQGPTFPGLQTRDPLGGWKSVTGTSWGTAKADHGFAWMQVYPVRPYREDPTRDRLALTLMLLGRGDGSAVDLDAVGFVAGAPTCCRPADSTRAMPGWCPAPGDTTVHAGVCPNDKSDDTDEDPVPKKE